MFIMQYQISLPADYDMNVIRQRVASKGPSFDTLDGLGLKCFLIRERGRFGAPCNEYAPVYLWPRVEAMWGFLAGSGFAGIKDAFGTPPVQTWPGFAHVRSAQLSDPKTIVSVTREDETLSRDADLIERRKREIDAANAAVERTPGLLARAVGLDPLSWRLVRFDYWARAQAELPAHLSRYEVLHVSAPAFAELHDTGRQYA
ncbi:DUF4865 family protein [Paraburkholderia solisilvae]|uniref:DUF4865 domain-containing protein n=1 Tax=Paraburkholderia solisilvae TaxID=624376 RepID=A0A6J5E851_9BURK|nr:DUF4865 family protein [Paraburkholderia solisilvae]CAB3761774.1 hypothetical protein LMG29739_03712 [Paraburkholderia solisilvae]